MASVEKVLVVGGGIGGLCAATALRQQGIATDLVEINPEFSVYGVGIIQPNNVLRALDKIGLAEKCIELGTPFPGWRIFDSHGNWIMDAPNATTAAPQFPPNNGITRPDLQKILSAAAYDHGVVIKLDTSVEQFEDDGAGVSITFSDGTTDRYDFVIACDGIYSDMRQRLFGEDPKPEFTGQGVWRYNFPRPDDMEWGEIHAGPQTKVGLTPIRTDLMYMFIVAAEPGNPHMPKDQLARLMRERLGGFTGRIAAMADHITDNDGVVYKPMENLILPSPWHRGRILVIGDAAHATTPHLAQGAAIAIEDAVLIAELLGGDSPLQVALAEFMSRRFERSKFVVETSDQIAQWELAEWSGTKEPDAKTGQLLHAATARLHEEY
jgi:2-polyprenyl-6-methoxyphenol hydroxylase-like FAD-dependent oxidoreductase